MDWLYWVLGIIMEWCYNLSGNYGLAIVLFTFITKIILLPLFLWSYYQGIIMVKIQPDINYIKVRYYGQKDLIAEEQASLFKEMKYSPLVSVIPTLIQLILLIGVVGVIRMGIDNPAIDMSFGPINLGEIPAEVGISLLWSPIVAGIAAFLLCLAQNKSNILQAEQSKMNKYCLTVFSVGLSLYLGWFVPVGTAFYWVCSNLFAVLQLYICNWIVNPRQYVDYDRLNDSRKQLDALQSVGKEKGSYFSENKKRERADYKKFFSVVNKHLVFYSESNGFYKYYRGFIEYLIDNTNITIHYITSDPNDNVFEMEKDNPQIRGYYIGENRLITLMMKMDADVVCMTMPDLDNYHIKRSYVRSDVEYIYIQHGVGSNNLGMRRGCTDHFDTILLAGVRQREEEEQIGDLYRLKQRKLIDVGYPHIDEMRQRFRQRQPQKNDKIIVLIAPSWQKDNIVDSCLEIILDELKGSKYKIIVRPHPQEVRIKHSFISLIKNKYESEGIEVQTDFSVDNSVLEADLLITDWSDICWEYAFSTHHPVLFINTPMKVMNPEYTRIKAVPLNIELRNQLGKTLDLDELDKTKSEVDYLISHSEEYCDKIEKLAKTYIYNLDGSAEVGARYIIQAVQSKIASRKNV